MDIFEDITLQAVPSVHVGGATAVNSKNNIDIPYNYVLSVLMGGGGTAVCRHKLLVQYFSIISNKQMVNMSKMTSKLSRRLLLLHFAPRS